MSTNRRGGTTTFVVAALALVVVGGVIWYFVSDPFRTKVNDSFKEATTWTPARIAKEPELYLTFCEEKAKDAMQKLKAAEISIAQSKGSIEQSRTEATQKVESGKALLKTLKEAYVSGGESNTWPISWNSAKLTKEAAEVQIVTLYKGMQGQQDRMTNAEAQLKRLDAQQLKILSARAETQQQLDKIKSSREMLKVQKITDDIATQLAGVQGVLTTTIDAAADTQGTIKTLDQLTNEAAPKVQPSDVKLILDQIK